jgi:hypothetical protein
MTFSAKKHNTTKIFTNFSKVDEIIFKNKIIMPTINMHNYFHLHVEHMSLLQINIEQRYFMLIFAQKSNNNVVLCSKHHVLNKKLYILSFHACILIGIQLIARSFTCQNSSKRKIKFEN